MPQWFGTGNRFGSGNRLDGIRRLAAEPSALVAGPARAVVAGPVDVPLARRRGPVASAAGPDRGPGGPRRGTPEPASPGPTTRRHAGTWHRRYARYLASADAAAGFLAGLISAALAGRGPAVVTGLLVGCGLVTALALTGTYDRRFQGQGEEEFRRVLLATLGLVAVASTVAFARDAQQLRAAVLGGVPVAGAGSLLLHLTGRVALRASRRRGRLRQRVVAVGLERSVAELVRTARRDPGAGVEIVAACVTQVLGDDVEGVPVLGRPADVLTVLEVTRADTVVLTAWSDVSQEELRRLSWDLEGTGVQLLVAPRVAEVVTPRLHVRTLGGIPLLDVDEPEFTGARRVAKTVLDYLLATAALLVLGPVMLVVATAVRMTSSGPVLFRQERIGRHGKPFVMHKFRSMYVDAEQRLAQLQHLNDSDGVLFKMRDDPRVTPVGRVLRRYSLDELPQLLDVVLGRMSLVGPRPPLPGEVDRYSDDVRRRLLVKPGITGLWQVSGRSDLSWDESVRLDLNYVENWFLGLDLSIIARTVSAVLASRGAY